MGLVPRKEVGILIATIASGILIPSCITTVSFAVKYGNTEANNKMIMQQVDSILKKTAKIDTEVLSLVRKQISSEIILHNVQARQHEVLNELADVSDKVSKLEVAVAGLEN